MYTITGKYKEQLQVLMELFLGQEFLVENAQIITNPGGNGGQLQIDLCKKPVKIVIKKKTYFDFETRGK